mgnify:CR=1 FL=1
MSLLCSGPLEQRKGPAAFATGPVGLPNVAAVNTRPRYVPSRTVHSAPRTQHCVLVHPTHAAAAAAALVACIASSTRAFFSFISVSVPRALVIVARRCSKTSPSFVIDFVEHPSSGPRGCVLELFNALGESIGVVTVPEHAVEPLRADEVLAVRPMVIAG